MRPALIERAAELTRRGEPFAIATVVSRQAPSSARLGDTAIVTEDGSFHGWVGGSCTKPTVVAEARRAIAEGVPLLIVLSPDPGATDHDGHSVFPMTCRSGGSVEISIQPVLPQPRLLVFGLSPIARALVRLGAGMGYGVEAIDPGAAADEFPEAGKVHAQPSSVAAREGDRSLFAVVATQGEWDEDALAAAVALAPDYLGVVASRRRIAELKEFLAHRLEGEQREGLDTISAPAGLDIKAQTAEEVAISILAEIVERRRTAPPKKRAVAAEPTESTIVTRDPICGMTVDPETAKHRAEYEGREYLFCCAGCRTRFLEKPREYATVGSAG